MKILFRVDASSKVGLGHLRRTLALAKALKKRHHEPSFLIDDGCESLPIDFPFPRLQGNATREPWDAIVVDSYTISPNEYQSLHALTRHMIIIADGNDTDFACEALIDHNLCARESLYPHRQSDKTQLLVGPRYAMIQEEIVQSRLGFVVRPRIQRILLTLGGGRNEEKIRLWLDWLSQTLPDAEIVILTPYPFELPAVSTYRLVCAPQDAGIVMMQADIAISAAGVTSLELACVGVPAIYLVLADNQMPGAEAAEKEGIGINLGTSEGWTLEKFQKIFAKMKDRDLRQRMSDRGRLFVDGLGAARLAEALENL